VEPRRGRHGHGHARRPDRTEAERAYDWLRSIQRPDGAWHQYYLADGIEQDKLDANTVAYIATGVYHHWLLTRDRGFLEEMWKVVEPAIEFVLDLQTPRGEILWARHADGTPWSFALLTGSSSMCHSLRCAIAIAIELGHDRPDWELSVAQLAHVIEHEPDAFAPKHRWAMDWYYPILAGALAASRPGDHLAERYDTFVMPGRVFAACRTGRGSPPPRPASARWPTSPPASATGPSSCSPGSSPSVTDDGRYWTGIVYPDEIHFPDAEQSTYTAAAVILAADALDGTSPTAGLFTDHDGCRRCSSSSISTTPSTRSPTAGADRSVRCRSARRRCGAAPAAIRWPPAR
jgi:hypothetical protein